MTAPALTGRDGGLISITQSMAVGLLDVPSRQAVVSRLVVAMSEVNAFVEGAAAKAGIGLDDMTVYVFADRLAIDAPPRPFGGTVVIARKIDRMAAATPIGLPKPPTNGGLRVLRILTRSVENGSLAFKIGDEANPWTPALVGDTPQLLTLVTGGADQRDVSADPGDMADLMGHPVLLSFLQAAFVGASSLLADAGSEDRERAGDMLDWAGFLGQVMRLDTALVKADTVVIAQQIAALRLLVAGDDGRVSVPALSLDFHLDRIKPLIDAIQAYERKIDTLETRADIASALGTITGGMAQDAKSDLADLRAAAADIDSQVEQLVAQGAQYSFDFLLRGSATRREAIRFNLGLQEKHFIDFCNAVLSIVEAVASMGAALAPAASHLGDAKKAAAQLKGELKAANDIANEFQGDASDFFNLIEPGRLDGSINPRSVALSTVELAKLVGKESEAAFRAILDTEDAAAKLAKSSMSLAKHTFAIPGTFAGPDDALTEEVVSGILATQNSDLAWNNFVRQIRLELQPHIDDGVDGADTYMLSVESLVDLGKALNANAVALAQAEIQRHDLARQIQSAENSNEQWRASSVRAASDAARKALMIAQLDRRMADVKRALLLSVESYRASWRYRNFSDPGLAIDFSMDSAELRTALAALQNRKGAALVASQPEQDFTADFELPIKLLGAVDFSRITSKDGSYGAAVLAWQSGGMTNLIWTLDAAKPPFASQLGPGARALFLSEAQFALLGVTGLDSVVTMQVVCSGMMQNICGGGSAQPPQTFSSARRVLDYAYRPSDGVTTIAWRPAQAVADQYAPPTPFSHWSASFAGTPKFGAGAKLRMRLIGVQRKV